MDTCHLSLAVGMRRHSSAVTYLKVKKEAKLQQIKQQQHRYGGVLNKLISQNWCKFEDTTMMMALQANVCRVI